MENQQQTALDPRIVLLRLSSLGDVVLTLPLLSALRKKYPTAKIDVVVRSEYADVLRGVEEICDLIEVEVHNGREGLKVLATQIAKNRYTHVLDLHNNFRTKLLRKHLGKNIRIINKRTFKRWLLVRFKINLLGDTPDVIGRYFETASDLQVKDSGAPPRYARARKTEADLIAIAPGSRHWNKRWPTEYFIEIVKRFVAEGFRVELFGSADDREITRAIANAVGDGITDLAGALTIAESTERMSRASLAITNDSGLMHIANALGLPTIALFGPTVREFGFFPRGENAHVLENAGLYCRPCTTIGREDCPEKHFRCMREITPERVLEIALPARQ